MRHYGSWAGRPEGTPEDKRYCAAEVHESGRGCRFHQCGRRRGKDDELCWQHRRAEQAGELVRIPPQTP